MNFTKWSAGAAAAATLLGASVGEADALSIRMTYGGTSVTLADAGAGDQDVLSGAVQYVEGAAASGVNFGPAGFSSVQVTGARCTVCLNRLLLEIDVARTATATSDFIVEVSDTGFALDDSLSWLAESDFSSIVDGVTATYETYWDGGDSLFGKANLIAAGDLTGSDGVGLESYISPAATSSPYSQTIVVTFGAAGWGPSAGTLQADAQLRTSAVPVPAALPLLAGALGAFGIARARGRSRKWQAGRRQGALRSA